MIRILPNDSRVFLVEAHGHGGHWGLPSLNTLYSKFHRFHGARGVWRPCSARWAGAVVADDRGARLVGRLLEQGVLLACRRSSLLIITASGGNGRVVMACEPPFERTDAIDALCMEIAELVVMLSPQAPLATNPTLRRELRIQTIYSSLMIEGNSLDERAVSAVLDGQRVLGDPRDILEVQNARAGRVSDSLSSCSRRSASRYSRLLSPRVNATLRGPVPSCSSVRIRARRLPSSESVSAA